MAGTMGLSWADPKLLALAGTIIFSAGGAWVKIAYLSEDVSDISEDIEEEESRCTSLFTLVKSSPCS